MRSRMFAIALLLVLLPIHVWSADAATTVGREQWNDTARQREVPVKIYKPIASEKPWPVVILSHGLGGSREALTYLGEHWASHGYFCVVLQHAGSDEALFRKLPLREGIENLKAAMTFEQLQQRCRDVSFAIDELTKLNAEK
ncbi:MAG: acetylhydrolase, partial [Phycisphaeraceae bacterium]|nr:acetylhydrolase [Phycisphaeraceae bacterium]